jgi:hypothetical protein
MLDLGELRRSGAVSTKWRHPAHFSRELLMRAVAYRLQELALGRASGRSGSAGYGRSDESSRPLEHGRFGKPIAIPVDLCRKQPLVRASANLPFVPVLQGSWPLRGIVGRLFARRDPRSLRAWYPAANRLRQQRSRLDGEVPGHQQCAEGEDHIPRQAHPLP